jgi:predicted CoA-binding protein
MRHLTRARVAVRRILRTARVVAVIEPSTARGARSNAIVDWLRREGFDVVPVRRDRADVAGLPSVASLDDIAGPVDMVLLWGAPGSEREVVEAAARKGAAAVWLESRRVTRDLEALAAARGVRLVKDLDITEERRGEVRDAGEPVALGARARRRHSDRTAPAGGWVEAGGGGSRGGGGGRAVIDEKKMLAPKTRRGRRGP